MKKAILLTLIFTHLTIIASGVIRKSFFTSPEFFQIKQLYQMLTAGGASFGFFSPEISNQFLVHFEVEPGHRRVALTDLVTREVGLRVGNMHRFFLYKYENEEAKRSTAASLSAAVFDLLPDAREVTFVSELHFIPTMHEAANGALPSRREVYRATFRLPAVEVTDANF